MDVETNDFALNIFSATSEVWFLQLWYLLCMCYRVAMSDKWDIHDESASWTTVTTREEMEREWWEGIWIGRDTVQIFSFSWSFHPKTKLTSTKEENDLTFRFILY